MENNNRDHDLILRYMDGSLTAGEQVEVEYRLKEDQSFQKTLNSHKQLIQGIRFNHLKGKLEQLKSLEAGLPAAGKEVSFYRRQWMPLSAAAAVLISAALWFVMIQNNVPDANALYASYYEPFDSPGTGLTRSTDDEMTVKARAYQAYDDGRYGEASDLFREALREKDDPIMHLCLGNALLELDKPSEAEAVFKHILENHGDLVTQAKWYLALTYLRQGKMELTKAELWEISKSSTYGETARQLLRELE